jgi:hypothetical protein
MRYLLAILFLILLCSVAFGERVRVLPQDANKQYVTVFGSGPEFATLVEAFSTDPDLKALRAKSHFGVIHSDSVMYKQRYAAYFPELPIVCVQSANGRVLFESAVLDDLKAYVAPSEAPAVPVVTPAPTCKTGECKNG